MLIWQEMLSGIPSLVMLVDLCRISYSDEGSKCGILLVLGTFGLLKALPPSVLVPYNYVHE